MFTLSSSCFPSFSDPTRDLDQDLGPALGGADVGLEAEAAVIHAAGVGPGGTGAGPGAAAGPGQGHILAVAQGREGGVVPGVTAAVEAGARVPGNTAPVKAEVGAEVEAEAKVEADLWTMEKKTRWRRAQLLLAHLELKSGGILVLMLE